VATKTVVWVIALAGERRAAVSRLPQRKLEPTGAKTSPPLPIESKQAAPLGPLCTLPAVRNSLLTTPNCAIAERR